MNNVTDIKKLKVVIHQNGWTIQTEDNECVATQYGGSDIRLAEIIVDIVNNHISNQKSILVQS